MARDSRVRPAPDRETVTLTVRVCGDLDEAAGAELTAVVVARLTGPEPPRTVRLDFRALEGIDRLGLAELLMIRRHTGAAGAALHLDNRPVALERLLRRTNVLGHLTAAETAEAAPERPGAGLVHSAYGD
ncbi:STAS domain-containing protein [Streptomyces sp. CHD11]|uniref:STAS domain-containing protein n=1 Tax=Streptomyces sp. CHD11 TaxID=2741325 RepID=UPI001BFC9991|nr:STAS domain-containing protein [Streptomyces sp. CHD11]MBT3149567.1 STAS domain-containing protein [Streptomyces sp. CHD11]